MDVVQGAHTHGPLAKRAVACRRTGVGPKSRAVGTPGGVRPRPTATPAGAPEGVGRRQGRSSYPLVAPMLRRPLRAATRAGHEANPQMTTMTMVIMRIVPMTMR